MKPFADRNRFIVGLVGLVLTYAIAAGALYYDKLPFLNTSKHYSAYFTEAGGLRPGAAVQVAGFRVGRVTSIDLDGNRVLVKFDVDRSVKLGELTEANMRTKSLLGAKVLQVTPRGDGQLTTIPEERTLAPYQLPDALGDLSKTINGLDTKSVSTALSTLADTFKDTPPDLKAAVSGVARFSQTLGTRDDALRNLLANANKASTVLSERADEIAQLVSNTNALLDQLRTQSAALNQIAGNLSAFSRQLAGFVSDNRAQLRPALEKLNGVITMVDNRKERLTLAVKYLNQFSMALGESVGSGPFFKAYLANLPGQLVQPFVEAAFSDLGLDPSTRLPSQLTDPPAGQPGTPALPVPYPRTGQGGDPHLTLPETITGNPGDHVCSSVTGPYSGPGCYPYREPLPAPAPGGPPPGPPALPNPAQASSVPGPQPVFLPAPGEPGTTSTQGAGR